MKPTLSKPAIILLIATVALTLVVIGVVVVIRKQESTGVIREETVTEPASQTYVKEIPLESSSGTDLPEDNEVSVSSESAIPTAPVSEDVFEQINSLIAQEQEQEEEQESVQGGEEELLSQIQPTEAEIAPYISDPSPTAAITTAPQLPKSGMGDGLAFFFAGVVSLGIIALAFVL